MGNCIRKDSSNQWGGDDWGTLSPSPVAAGGIGHENKLYVNPMKMDQEQSFHGEKKGTNSQVPSSTTTGTEVKIKITKKQLEELLSKVDAQGQSVKDVLTQLLNLGDGSDAPPRSWRPALQSIPEAEVY